jgi:hypothetical protein
MPSTKGCFRVQTNGLNIWLTTTIEAAYARMKLWGTIEVFQAVKTCIMPRKTMIWCPLECRIKIHFGQANRVGSSDE